jgi:hypothetical protein
MHVAHPAVLEIKHRRADLRRSQIKGQNVRGNRHQFLLAWMLFSQSLNPPRRLFSIIAIEAREAAALARFSGAPACRPAG